MAQVHHVDPALSIWISLRRRRYIAVGLTGVLPI